VRRFVAAHDLVAVLCVVMGWSAIPLMGSIHAATGALGLEVLLAVLIGEGVPLFGALPRDIRLRHIATRHYPSGLVQSEYQVPG
jgi:hypothetical protein